MNGAPVKVTALDVARLAGVSQSAVSRVFTPGASASRATVAKVRAAAEELGYRPNPLARAMITGRTRRCMLTPLALNAVISFSDAKREKACRVATSTAIGRVIATIPPFDAE